MLTGYGISLDDASEPEVACVLDAINGRWQFLGCGEDEMGEVRCWFQPTDENVEARAVMEANKDNVLDWVAAELIDIVGSVPWNYKVTPRVVYSDYLVQGGRTVLGHYTVVGVYDSRGAGRS